MLRRLFAIFPVWLIVWQACAQGDLPEAFRSRLKRAAATGPQSSLSGQFLIYDQPDAFVRPIMLTAEAKTNFVRIDPSLLAVSGERIKRALLAELSAPDQWQGKIHLTIHHARTPDEPVIIGSSQVGANWTYYVDLPDTMEHTRLVASIVNVLLLEIANRNALRSAEIPLWLGEGLSRQLMCATTVPLVLNQPDRVSQGISANVFDLDGVKRDPLAMAHEMLQTRPPLTLEELSWPENPQLEGEAGEAYRSSAQLFVSALMQLDDGRVCLRAMIRELPRHLNWQVSFRDAFGGHFASQLELEKWWALRLVTFTGRDLAQTWPREQSWSKLDEIIRPTVEVRTAINEMPFHTEISLQRIVREWDFAKQAEVFNEKIRQLFVLRTRVSQDLVGLVDDYRQVLDVYMQKRIKSGANRKAKAQAILGLDSLAQEVVAQLDMLDARREILRQPAVTPQPVTASLPVNR